MVRAFPRRIHQDENFIVNGFSGKKIEYLTALESVENPGSPVIIFLKAEDNNLQRFFLDAGRGFWEEAETMEDENEAGFIGVDYAQKFDIQNEKINSIVCEKVQNNSRIVITLENKALIVLRYKKDEIIDSDCELVKIGQNMAKFELHWQNIKIGILTETDWDMRSSGTIAYTFDYKAEFPENEHLADFIKHSIKTFNFLEEGVEENYLKMSEQDEAGYSDIVDSTDWRIVDSQGKSIKILCPIFRDNNEITWQKD